MLERFFRLRTKKKTTTDRVAPAPESTHNTKMMCQHVRGERLDKVRRFGPHPRLTRSSRPQVSCANVPCCTPSVSLQPFASACPRPCSFVSLSCIAWDACRFFFCVVMVVVALVVFLSACYCGSAFGRADACCRPLSSVRACFWLHFVLDAFSDVFFFCCTAPVTALLM